MKPNDERQRVTTALEEDIVFARFRPRERLIEVDLMARYQARRHIVRDALDALEMRGLVTRKANQGAQVRDLDSREIEELYFMRELLQRAAIEAMELPFDPERLARIEAIQLRHERAIADQDLAAAFVLNEAFHDALNAACGNQTLIEALRQYAERTNLVRSYAFGAIERLKHSAHEHRQIMAAAAGADKSHLAALLIAHILRAKTAYQNQWGV